MKRFFAVDIHRGLIMIGMMQDHALIFIGGLGYYQIWHADVSATAFTLIEFFSFLTRAIAPGFFLLMGMSVSFYACKKLKQGWSQKRIKWSLIKRGLWLIVLQFFAVNIFWFLETYRNSSDSYLYSNLLSQVSDGSFWYLGILYSLGISLIITSLFLGLQRKYVIAAMSVSFLLSVFYVGLENLSLSSPGFISIVADNLTWTRAELTYPLAGWLGIALLGLLCGKFLLEAEIQTFKRMLIFGFVFLVLAFLLRFFSVGNAPYDAYDSVKSFLTLSRKPPGLVFLLYSLGLNFALLGLLSFIRTRPKWLKPVEIFGHTALFFYVAHLGFLAVVIYIFPNVSSIHSSFLLWPVLTVLIYPVCYFWYRRGLFLK